MSAPLAYITGASSGIGQALAARYLSGGYRLALVARRTAPIEQWLHTQQPLAKACAVYAADVCDVQAVGAAALACINAQGLPDVVIANAGISVGMDSAVPEDLEVMRATLETNVLGMAATFQRFIAPMRRRGSGRLVGIASVAGIRGLPGHGAYCSSKAAAIAFCESLRGELKGSGVKVVTLVPGYVDTPLTRKNRYSMPFLMPVDKFADRAFAAIAQGASYRVIPWQMGLIAKLLRSLPNSLFDQLLAGQPRKRRRGE
ncbi:MAG: SDR family oxidoreductase [Burkholderiaceae bacterium]